MIIRKTYNRDLNIYKSPDLFMRENERARMSNPGGSN